MLFSYDGVFVFIQHFMQYDNYDDDDDDDDDSNIHHLRCYCR